MLKMNAFLNSVVRSGKPIYCAAPLFSPLDRMAGANVAGILETIIRRNAKDSNIDISNCIFLPFRDTSQSTFAGPDRAQRIFQLDIDTLRASSALLARFDGLAKDSGVAMEIGFAFGVSLPIGILVTSFMGEGFGANESEWQVDPVIAQMADICFCMPIFPRVATSYYQSQHIHEWEGVRQFVETALEEFSARTEPRPLSRIEGSISTVYVDIMGGRYEWTRDVQRRIRASCTPLGFEVKPSRRYSSPARDPTAGAYQDIQSALSASVGVFSGDAPELDPGSAALFGLCKAIGIPTILQYSSPIIYKGAGNQQMKVNLMIEQSADIITGSTNETIIAIKHLLRG